MDSFTFYPLPHFLQQNLVSREVIIHVCFFCCWRHSFFPLLKNIDFLGKEGDLILTLLSPSNCSQLWHLLKVAVFWGWLVGLFFQPLAKNIVSEVCLSCELVIICKYRSSTLAKLAEWLWTSLRQKTSSMPLGLVTVITISESVIQMCTEF